MGREEVRGGGERRVAADVDLDGWSTGQTGTRGGMGGRTAGEPAQRIMRLGRGVVLQRHDKCRFRKIELPE